MPAILGPFESSLRGRTSNAGEGEAKSILHHSCSGASHGSGCLKKEKHRLEREREQRNRSLPPDINGHVPDILLDSLPASGYCGRRVMDTWTGFNWNLKTSSSSHTLLAGLNLNLIGICFV